MTHPRLNRRFLPSVFATFRAWVVCGMTVLFIGCAAPPTVTPISDSSQRYQFLGYSVLPPKGYGWYLLTPSGPELPGGVFAKQTSVPTHTIRAIVSLLDMEGKRFSSPEEFGQFAEQEFRDNTSPSRFKILELKHVQDKRLGEYCVRVDALAEDHGVPGFAGSVFYMETHDLFCIHPDDPDRGVQMSYSQRAASKSDFIKLKPEVEPFMQSLQFTAIP